MTRAHRMCASCATALDPYEMTRCRACEAESVYATREGIDIRVAPRVWIAEGVALGFVVLAAILLAIL